ncbi:CHRD domain-containing protein [Paenibacillus soyae]
MTNASGTAVFREVRLGPPFFGNEQSEEMNGRGWRRRLGLRFRLRLFNIRRVTEAHIHLGRPGQNGPVVATLFGPNREGVTFRNGTITGTLRGRDLEGPLAGSTIARLVREIERGNAYVNVHTRRNPDGEIRGQIHD